MPTERRATISANKALLLDLVAWVAREPRSRGEVIEVWGTSCPRFPVWEDAVDLRLLARVQQAGVGEMIQVTREGREFLRANDR